MISKRSFLVGLIAAPVIIRAGILMPIKVIEPVRVFTLADYEALMYKMMLDWQEKIAEDVMKQTGFMGFKLIVENNDIKTQGITFQMVYK